MNSARNQRSYSGRHRKPDQPAAVTPQPVVVAASPAVVEPVRVLPPWPQLHEVPTVRLGPERIRKATTAVPNAGPAVPAGVLAALLTALRRSK